AAVVVVDDLAHRDSEVPVLTRDAVAGEPDGLVVGAVGDGRPGGAVVAAGEHIGAVRLGAVVAAPADVGPGQRVLLAEVDLPRVVRGVARVVVVAVVVGARRVEDSVVRRSGGRDVRRLAGIGDAVRVPLRETARRGRRDRLALRDQLVGLVH